MVRPPTLAVLAAAAAVAAAVLRHGRHATRGHQVPGGILIGDAARYDTLSRLLLSPLIKRIAADVASVAPAGARVLEVGVRARPPVGPVSRHHGLEVTGLDLDPAMITRARARPLRERRPRRPSFWWATWPRWRFPTDRSTWFPICPMRLPLVEGAGAESRIREWAGPAAARRESCAESF